MYDIYETTEFKTTRVNYSNIANVNKRFLRFSNLIKGCIPKVVIKFCINVSNITAHNIAYCALVLFTIAFLYDIVIHVNVITIFFTLGISADLDLRTWISR